MIVTFNLSDFPAPALAPFGVRASHPDPFLCALFDAASSPFLASVARHRASLRRPPRTREEYVTTLRQNGLRNLADRLERHVNGW